MSTPPLTTVVGGLVIQHWPQQDSAQGPDVPQSISRAQGKAMLIQAGLWDAALAFVAGIADPVERALAEVALHDTQDWRRDSAFLAKAATALGITSEQMDEMFIAARAIEF